MLHQKHCTYGGHHQLISSLMLCRTIIHTLSTQHLICLHTTCMMHATAQSSGTCRGSITCVRVELTAETPTVFKLQLTRTSARCLQDCSESFMLSSCTCQAPRIKCMHSSWDEQAILLSTSPHTRAPSGAAYQSMYNIEQSRHTHTVQTV